MSGIECTGIERGAPRRAVRGVAFSLVAAALAGAALLAPALAPAQQVTVDPQAAERFADVPDGVRLPRGIAADPESGQLYVSNFVPGGRNVLLRVDARDGRILATREVGAVPRFGLIFNSRDGKLYMASGGALIGQDSTIQRIAGDFGPDTPLEDVAIVPDLPAPPPRTEMGMMGARTIVFEDSPAAGPNCLDFLPGDGSLLFTDSLQGAVLRIADPSSPANICPDSSACVETFLQSGILATTAAIGADGLAVSEDGREVFVNNAGDNRVLGIDVQTRDVRVVNEGIPFPDGVILGPNGTLLIVAFMGDSLIVLDAQTGERRAELGSFLGRDGDAVRGLSMPAQAARIGNDVFITNFSPARPVPQPTLARIRLTGALLGD